VWLLHLSRKRLFSKLAPGETAARRWATSFHRIPTVEEPNDSWTRVGITAAFANVEDSDLTRRTTTTAMNQEPEGMVGSDSRRVRSPRFPTARFHVTTGPASLFGRVHFKMRGRYQLKTHPAHVQERAVERDAPMDRLTDFDSSVWRLMTAEVRTDKGRFVNTSWSVDVAGTTWWVVIGFDQTMKTVIRASEEKLGLGDGIVRSGPLYAKVAMVNRDLMAAESTPSQEEHN
jgi:hypothetical protein